MSKEQGARRGGSRRSRRKDGHAGAGRPAARRGRKADNNKPPRQRPPPVPVDLKWLTRRQLGTAFSRTEFAKEFMRAAETYPFDLMHLISTHERTPAHIRGLLSQHDKWVTRATRFDIDFIKQVAPVLVGLANVRVLECGVEAKVAALMKLLGEDVDAPSYLQASANCILDLSSTGHPATADRALVLGVAEATARLVYILAPRYHTQRENPLHKTANVLHQAVNNATWEASSEWKLKLRLARQQVVKAQRTTSIASRTLRDTGTAQRNHRIARERTGAPTRAQHVDLPGEHSKHGRRHANDHACITDIEVLPTAAEVWR